MVLIYDLSTIGVHSCFSFQQQRRKVALFPALVGRKPSRTSLRLESLKCSYPCGLVVSLVVVVTAFHFKKMCGSQPRGHLSGAKESSTLIQPRHPTTPTVSRVQSRLALFNTKFRFSPSYQLALTTLRPLWPYVERFPLVTATSSATARTRLMLSIRPRPTILALATSPRRVK